MIVGDPPTPQPDLAAERDPVGIGQQRIITRRPGEHAFREPTHPQPVELDAQREHRGPDQQSFTEPADLIAGGVELERERSPEHVEGRSRFDLVETAEPFERSFDPARGFALEWRPRDRVRLRRRSNARRDRAPRAPIPPTRWARGRGRRRARRRSVAIPRRAPARLRLVSPPARHPRWSGPSASRRSGRAAPSTARHRPRLLRRARSVPTPMTRPAVPDRRAPVRRP